MTEAERLEWGRTEHWLRIADIGFVKTGKMTLAEAQKKARSRARQSGMTPHEAHMALVDGQRTIPEEAAQREQAIREKALYGGHAALWRSKNGPTSRR